MNTNILIPSKAACWRPQPSGEHTLDGVPPFRSNYPTISTPFHHFSGIFFSRNSSKFLFSILEMEINNINSWNENASFFFLFIISFVKVGKFRVNKLSPLWINKSAIGIFSLVSSWRTWRLNYSRFCASFYPSANIWESRNAGVTQIFVLIVFSGGKFGLAHLPGHEFINIVGMYRVVCVAVRNPYEFRNILYTIHYPRNII